MHEECQTCNKTLIDRKTTTIYHRLCYTVNHHFDVALPNTHHQVNHVFVSKWTQTQFGEQQRTHVHMFLRRCRARTRGLFDSVNLARVWQTSKGLQKSRHVLATRRCCHAIGTPEGMIVVPTLENHLHVYNIFPGKGRGVRLQA